MHHHHYNCVDLHLYVLDGHFNWCQDDLFLVSHLKTFHEGQMPEKRDEKKTHLNPGFDVWEVVDGGQNGFSLVLLRQFTVRQL